MHRWRCSSVGLHGWHEVTHDSRLLRLLWLCSLNLHWLGSMLLQLELLKLLLLLQLLLLLLLQDQHLLLLLLESMGSVSLVYLMQLHWLHLVDVLQLLHVRHLLFRRGHLLVLCHSQSLAWLSSLRSCQCSSSGGPPCHGLSPHPFNLCSDIPESSQS